MAEIFHDRLIDIIDQAQEREVGAFGSEYGLVRRSLQSEVLPINSYGEICGILDSDATATVLDIESEHVYGVDRTGRVLSEHSSQKEENDTGNILRTRRDILGEIRTLQVIIEYNQNGRVGNIPSHIAMHENNLYQEYISEGRLGFEGNLGDSRYEREVFMKIVSERIQELQVLLKTAPIEDITGLEQNGMIRCQLVVDNN